MDRRKLVGDLWERKGSSLSDERQYALNGVRVPRVLINSEHIGDGDQEGVVDVDIEVSDGLIARIEKAAGTQAGLYSGRMVWPCLVDMHTHLDKGHAWPRVKNVDGSFDKALAAVRVDRLAHWDEADIRARMEFGLRCAYAHGTKAIRSHLDSIPPHHRITWPLAAQLREQWAGRIELQFVALAAMHDFRGGYGDELADLVVEHGGIMGGVTYMDPNLKQDLRDLFERAGKRGLDLDLHVDESLDPEARSLYHIAETAIETGFSGRVVCGHCCSLARQEADQVKRTLDLVAEAGIAIVSLPMCNLYLQDRESGRTPRWRGVTSLHEIRARGIPIAAASDNCRDPFYAYGDHDMHEVFREAVRIAHLDHPFGDWPALVTETPAKNMGLEDVGVIRVGTPADLVIFDGRSMNEILSRPESHRIVLRDGERIDTTLPDYAELDEIISVEERF